MFSKPELNMVRSSDGFELKGIGGGRSGEWIRYEYREGGEKITFLADTHINSEGVFFLCIHPNAIEKWDGVTELLALEEQQRILKNIREAMAFNKNRRLLIYGIDTTPSAVAQASLSDLVGQLKQNPKVTSITLANAMTGESHTIPNPLPKPGNPSQN